MTEAAWTPGPWRAVGTENAWQVVQQPGNLLVAEMPLGRDDSDDATIPHDAHLIASAPELHDSLQGIVALLADTGFHNSIEMAAARAVLRRARGETL